MQTILGTFVKALPETRGESQRGPWVRGGFVIQQYGSENGYGNTIAFTCFGEERVAAVKGFAPGQQVQVSFNPESREYNGRWYTECYCVSVQTVGAQQSQQGWPGQGYGGYGQQPQQGWQAPTAQQQTMAAAPTAQQPVAQPVAAAYNPLQPDPDLPF